MLLNAKQHWLAGLRAGIPVILGVVPVGIAYAVMARQAGLSPAETGGMSALVCAGASQMMAVGMYAQGAGLAAMILTTLLLNLRHLIMSTCVMHPLRSAPLPLRLLSAFCVTDETFALFTTAPEEQRTVPFFLGLVTSIYGAWNLSTLAGALMSDLLPDIVSASLGIAIYAMFIGILVPSLTGNWRMLALVAMTAVCNTLLSGCIAPGWALIISTLLCAWLGTYFVPLPGKEAANA